MILNFYGTVNISKTLRAHVGIYDFNALIGNELKLGTLFSIDQYHLGANRNSARFRKASIAVEWQLALL